MTSRRSFYHYIYYKLYKLSQKTEKQWNQGLRVPESIASTLLTILLAYNLAVVFLLIDHFHSLSIDLKPWHGILLGLFIMAFNYYLFVFRENIERLNLILIICQRPRKRKEIFYFGHTL